MAWASDGMSIPTQRSTMSMCIGLYTLYYNAIGGSMIQEKQGRVPPPPPGKRKIRKGRMRGGGGGGAEEDEGKRIGEKMERKIEPKRLRGEGNGN